MKLYRVWNGYLGYSGIRCVVVAASEDRARQLASDQFKRESERRVEEISERAGYDESYWTDLEVELLSEDVSKEWVGGPYD